MWIGQAALSIALRILVFSFVIGAMSSGQHARKARPKEGVCRPEAQAARAPSLSRACLGFAASLVLTCLVLVLIGSLAQTPAPASFRIALRGSLD